MGYSLSRLRAALPALAMVIAIALALSLVALYMAPVIDDGVEDTTLRVYEPQLLEELARELVEKHRDISTQYSRGDR